MDPSRYNGIAESDCCTIEMLK